MNVWVYAPVIAGMWKQHELWDGTYTLDDLIDAHEMLLVGNENKRRFAAYQETMQQQEVEG